MGTKNPPPFPRRRGSNQSEDDFFDIPDEPCLAIVKRQLRHFRTWVFLILFLILILYFRREGPPPPPLPHIDYDRVDWTRYAYSQYATSSAYLCNALMVFEALQRFGSRAQRVLFYPENWDVLVDGDRDRDSQLLNMARDTYNVQLVPIDVQMIKAGAGMWMTSREKVIPRTQESIGCADVYYFDPTTGPDEPWDKSISKLLAFGETEFDRVIHLDSDVNLLQSMDELFFLPSTKVAMPRAYWRLPEEKQLSSLLVVIEPSYREFSALMDAAQPAIHGQVLTNLSSPNRYDMELLNERYGDSALVLPHRQYGLITGEFRAQDHKSFLGNDYETWDPDKVLSEAKLVHFSDWPLPKPWVMWPQKVLAETLPKCLHNPGTPRESGCRDREVWRRFYDDFRRRRRDICRLLSYPAPDVGTEADSDSKSDPEPIPQ